MNQINVRLSFSVLKTKGCSLSIANRLTDIIKILYGFSINLPGNAAKPV
jgi:hypothetical protein